MKNRGLALLTNGLALGLIAILWIIEEVDRDLYYVLVQEDGSLEWGTVVLMVPAAWLCVQGVLRQRAAGKPVWFMAGMALFCVFFAGEEISWGQRLMTYQPPEYFLENNSQQELNVHNLFKQIVRTKYLLMGILGIYGVALPLLQWRSATIRGLLQRVGMMVPPATLAPAFLATGALLVIYPWKYSGEVAECLFSLLLFVTIAAGVEPPDSPSRLSLLARVSGIIAVSGLLAWTIPAGIAFIAHGSDQERRTLATAEVEALVEAWHLQAASIGNSPSKCGTHIRLYTWVEKYDFGAFRDGPFTDRTDDETRSKFFLDPWNNPYWVRHVCKKKRTKRVMIYSFGPNSRRDSSKREIDGDDVGVVFEPTE